MNCKAVQTNDDIDNEYLWKDYTYFSGQTNRIVRHFEEFSTSLKREYFEQKEELQVLDIGSNDGSLLKEFNKLGCTVVGIDPADTVVEVALEQGIDTKLGLFNASTSKKYFSDEQFDVITAFNVFAHSADMPEMAGAVKRCLKPEGIFCFEVQYLGDIVKKSILGTVFHEHMVHYSLTSAKSFLKSFQLKIIDFERNDIQNGSIVFKVCHEGSQLASTARVDKLADLEEYEMQIGITTTEWSDGFLTRLNTIKAEAKAYLDDKNRVCAYGAARSGPTIAIQYGVEEKISSLFDDHPSKCGMFSPFKGLKVRSTSELDAAEYGHTIILAYIHYKSIIRSNMRYLRDGGKFILLWPSFKVIDIYTLSEIGL